VWNVRKGSMHGLSWHERGRGSDVTRKCEKLRRRIFSLFCCWYGQNSK